MWNDLPFLAQEFQKRYHGYLHNPPKTYLRCLLGISAAENIQNGYKALDPIFIGNKDIAKLVFESGSQSLISVSSIEQDIQELLEDVSKIKKESG